MLKPVLAKSIQEIDKYVNFNTSNIVRYLLMPFSVLCGMFTSFYVQEGDKIFELICAFEVKFVIKLFLALLFGSGITVLFYDKAYV